MICWRCGRLGRHTAWCSMPGGCDHCGWRPHRWWCAVGHVYVWTANQGYARILEPV